TKTWAWPVSRRFEFLARRVARSRSTAPGKTARVNSSGISRKWPPADIANPTREWGWRRPRAADEDGSKGWAKRRYGHDRFVARRARPGDHRQRGCALGAGL